MYVYKTHRQGTITRQRAMKKLTALKTYEINRKGKEKEQKKKQTK